MTTQRMMIPGPPRNGETSQPRLYGLLAVEVEPGKIVYYHLELDHHPAACTVEMTRETDDVYVDDTVLLSRAAYGPWHIDATISGTVVSDRPDYQPPTRTRATTGGAVLDERDRPVIALPAGPDHE